MPLLRRRHANTDVEQSVLTGMIVSDKLLKSIMPIFNLEYFKNPFTKTVAKWVVGYYRQYELAPLAVINDLYKVNKEKLQETEAELIATFLDRLSKRYESSDQFNADYLIDKTLAYFKERALTLTGENILSYIEVGQMDKAELEIHEYKQISKIITNWTDAMEGDFVMNNFVDTDDDDSLNGLFKLVGPLGDHLGHFERDWLVAFLAPMKRGKTFFLQEVALQAIHNRLNVAIISLEMNAQSMSNRFYRMMVGMGDKESTVFPVFDCRSNQNGSCTLPQRTNNRVLFTNNQIPEYDKKNPYRICTECRGKDPFDYKVATWFEENKKDKISLYKVSKFTQAFKNMYGDHLRIKSYPAYSANLETIKRDLNVLEMTEDFIPDIVIIDYADILAPEDKKVEGRDRYDETWKMLKNMAATRHCLVVTASQSNKKTLEKKNVKVVDVSEDIRKVAHVDAMYSLSQTPDEKERGVMRVGVIAHRWKDFNEKQVIVLQNLATGQVALDSEFGGFSE